MDHALYLHTYIHKSHIWNMDQYLACTLAGRLKQPRIEQPNI